jgi:hypothetical protein
VRFANRAACGAACRRRRRRRRSSSRRSRLYTGDSMAEKSLKKDAAHMMRCNRKPFRFEEECIHKKKPPVLFLKDLNTNSV